MKLTLEEKKLILEHRKEQKESQERWDRQKACKHTNRIYTGRWGHNGDDWYKCPECGLEWDE